MTVDLEVTDNNKKEKVIICQMDSQGTGFVSAA